MRGRRLDELFIAAFNPASINIDIPLNELFENCCIEGGAWLRFLSNSLFHQMNGSSHRFAGSFDGLGWIVGRSFSNLV